MLFFSKQMCATLALLSSQATLMSFGEKKKEKKKNLQMPILPLTNSSRYDVAQLFPRFKICSDLQLGRLPKQQLAAEGRAT